MKKKVAILTQKGSLSKGIQHNTIVNIFNLDEDTVTEVEQIMLDNNSNNYFSILMAFNEVSLVYTDSIANELKNTLYKIGITTKCKDDIIPDDKFFSRFIFD